MRVRDRRLDVAKGVLISLVVFGHLLPRVGLDDGLTTLAYTVIYAFHMPAFIFLAGITAKSTRLLERLLTFVILLGGIRELTALAVEDGREVNEIAASGAFKVIHAVRARATPARHRA